MASGGPDSGGVRSGGLAEAATTAAPRAWEGLVGRTILLGIVPMAVLLGAMIAIAGVDRYSSLERNATRELGRLATAAALDLDREIRGAVDLSRTIAQMQSGGMFGMRQLSLETLRHLVERNPWCLGTYLCYEPDADGKDAHSLRWGLPEGSIDEAGRFLPYWFRDHARGGALALKINLDLDTSLYYDGVRRAFAATGEAAPMVGDPYFYDGDLLVEHTYPIVIGGRFMGIAGADRSLRGLRNDAQRLALVSDAAVFVISGRGIFAATSLDGDEPGRPGARVPQTLRTSRFAALFEPLLEPADAPRVLVAPSPIDGVETYWAAATIETGGWTVILARPASEVTGPLLAQTIWMSGVSGLAVLGVVALLVALLRNFSQRIRVAAAAASAIAAGDLAAESPASAQRDEAGLLLRTLAAMRLGLAEIVRRVKVATISLHTAITEVAAASRQQEAAAGEFEHTATEIAAAVVEIRRTSETLVASMGELRRFTGETADLADAGRGGLEEMRGSMDRLEEGSASIAQRLATINERAEGITRIVTTIATVADQTNLLSVNAAIEAEKAGEQGRGFLVVAREIRRLADQTAGATGEIERFVEQMRSAVSAGVMEMDRFAELVRLGCGQAETSTGRMSGILAQVDASVERFAALDAGMQQQAAAAGQIDGAMARLGERAREGAESVREFARSAAELQRALSSLRSVVDTFRLPEQRPVQPPQGDSNGRLHLMRTTAKTSPTDA